MSGLYLRCKYWLNYLTGPAIMTLLEFLNSPRLIASPMLAIMILSDFNASDTFSLGQFIHFLALLCHLLSHAQNV